MSTLDTVTIVIRSVGERTKAACRASILAQGIRNDQIITVQEAPFSKAMRVGFEAGIAAGRDWTFCIDADVVLRAGSIAAMLRAAQAQPPHVFEVQGVVLDKLFVTLREAGNHLFRTSLLSQMIDCIPEEGTSLRPESSAMERMKTLGYPWVRVPYVVGLHDFGQSNRDIFRKCYTHAQKHSHLLADLIPKMRGRAQADPDFQVAIMGLAEGLMATTAVRIDTGHKVFSERFEALRIAEKPPCGEEEFSPEAVERLLRDYAQADDLTVRYLPFSGPEALKLDGTEKLTQALRWRTLWRNKQKSIGFWRTLLYIVGNLLEIIGGKVSSAAKK